MEEKQAFGGTSAVKEHVSCLHLKRGLEKRAGGGGVVFYIAC